VDALKPNQIFAGRYRIERFLAQGGMGAVFVGEQTATELSVAIKVLFPHVLGSKDAISKFELEARVAARVRSDHIVKVLDAGYDEETGLPFLVMEMLEGHSLEDVVNDGGPLGPLETVTYLSQCALGLDKAHGYADKHGVRQPIVHRDLKPENLFLAKRESGEALIKILDFGIAKVLTDTANLSQELKGTPLYMAYEQAAGSRVSPQTDIWAFGLIAFFLLTGRPYWAAASGEEGGLAALFGEILTKPIALPSVRARELGVEPCWGAEFDQWFLRCVDREPERRFLTAGDAARELARALRVTPIAVPGSPISEVREERKCEGLAGGHGATFGSGMTASAPRLPMERGMPRIGAIMAAAAFGVVVLGGVVYAALSAPPDGLEPVSADPIDLGTPPVESASRPDVPLEPSPGRHDASAGSAEDPAPRAALAAEVPARKPRQPAANDRVLPAPKLQTAPEPSRLKGPVAPTTPLPSNDLYGER
jgi:eukaryotic-like serine/threonine-protein kinase